MFHEPARASNFYIKLTAMARFGCGTKRYHPRRCDICCTRVYTICQIINIIKRRLRPCRGLVLVSCYKSLTFRAVCFPPNNQEKFDFFFTNFCYYFVFGKGASACADRTATIWARRGSKPGSLKSRPRITPTISSCCLCRRDSMSRSSRMTFIM